MKLITSATNKKSNATPSGHPFAVTQKRRTSSKCTQRFMNFKGKEGTSITTTKIIGQYTIQESDSLRKSGD